MTPKGVKSAGKYRNWLNIKNRGEKGESTTDWKAEVNEQQMVESQEDLEILIDNLKDLSINENEEEIPFLEDICSNKELLERAKFTELENWKRNKV